MNAAANVTREDALLVVGINVVLRDVNMIGRVTKDSNVG
jgi:hypothetical protein